MIRVAVERLPGCRDAEPPWLRTTADITSADALDRAPKPSPPGPGRPPGPKNRRPATRHDAGKNPKPDKQDTKTRRQTG